MKRVWQRVMAVVAASAMSAALVGGAFGADRPQTDVEKKGLEYLTKAQKADGSWVPEAGPAVTAMVVRGMLQAGVKADDPAIKKALEFIEKSKKSDGGWYGESNATYNTSIVLATMGRLPDEVKGKYKEQIASGQAFLKSIQSGTPTANLDDKQKVVDKDHPWFGGFGYSQGKTLQAGRRPDLSNTQFAIAGLRDSGVPANDPSIQNALVFLTRVQAAEGNNAPWAKGRDDGGFIYSMRWNDKHQFYGESEGSDLKDRDGNDILATYGSMTYAGLKSLLYADVKKDDPRVKAALKYISNNWTLDKNPGLNNEQGLYYFYHTYASALSAYGQDEITDAKGVKHDWRKELTEKLGSMQKPDGSFVNAADRWMESNPVLVTTYVVLGLQEARR